MAEPALILVSPPARPWLPWFAFGVLVGALGPDAAPLALARLGVDCGTSTLWWLVGLPLALIALLPLGPDWLRRLRPARWRIGLGATAR